MQLEPGAFNAFLSDIGQDVLWRRASLCPCRDPHSGSPKPGCPMCGGARGVIWDPPVAAVTGVTSVRIKREFAAFGLWESGDEVLTIPNISPLYGCGEKDRVVMVNSSEPFQAVLTRGKALERLLYPVISVETAFWLNPTGDAFVYGPVPTVPDYGVPTWSDGAGPPVGTQYSLRGRRQQEYYMVAELPQERAHFHGLQLPRLCHFRRYDLFGRVADAS